MAITLAALTAGASAYGENPTKGTVANLTLKLTEYLTDPALLLKDENGKVVPGKIPTFENEYTVESSSKSVYTYEYGSKITTYKISNKEFLESLKDDGVITEIKGWAVVLVESDGDNTTFIMKKGVTPITFIMKKGVTPINVSQYLYLLWGDAGAEQESYKSVVTETETSYSEKETGSYKAKYLVGVKSEFSFLSLDLKGVYDESATLKTFGKGEDAYRIPGARSVNSITGSLSFDDGFDDFSEFDDEYDYEMPSVVTGSISIAAGKQVNLSDYPGSVFNF